MQPYWATKVLSNSHLSQTVVSWQMDANKQPRVLKYLVAVLRSEIRLLPQHFFISPEPLSLIQNEGLIQLKTNTSEEAGACSRRLPFYADAEVRL